MLLKIVYLLTCRILGVAVLVFRGDRTMAAELLVVRGESRSTTWAYKFVIFKVSAKIGRHFWRHPARSLDAEAGTGCRTGSVSTPRRNRSGGICSPLRFAVLLHTDPRDMGCAEAMDMLHVYADLVAAGVPAEERYPGVAAHLRACGPCGEDFEGLLAAIAGEAP